VLGDQKVLDILRGTSGNSIVVASTLRRAVATTTLALWPRLERTGEKVHLLSFCQEISRNVDTASLSPKGTVADLPFNRVAPHCSESKCNAGVFNATMNQGNKSLGYRGKQRIEDFNKWAFECHEDTIIVGGHSLWFKTFFNLYLPYGLDHKAKTHKLTNSGVVVFNLHKVKNEKSYFIDPQSLQTVYGGYTMK
jgi:hypothetical protein